MLPAHLGPRRLAPALSVALGLVFAALLAGQIPAHSPARDEPIHIVSGLRSAACLGRVSLVGARVGALGGLWGLLPPCLSATCSRNSMATCTAQRERPRRPEAPAIVARQTERD